MKLKISTSVLLIATSLFFIIVGTVTFFVVKKTQQQNFQKKLFHSVDVTLAAINPERVVRQATHITDNTSEDYHRLKEQLQHLGNTLHSEGIDSIYLMSTQDNKIFFIADSLDPSDPHYSDPGIPYYNPPEKLTTVFNNGMPLSVGPYTDEYGTFLSYFVPIKNFSDNAIVGVLGGDVDYGFFQKEVLKTQLYSLLGVFFLYAIAVVGSLYWKSHFLLKQKNMEAKKMIENVINTLPDLFYVIKNDGSLLMWNKSLNQNLGYSDEELRKKKFSDLIIASDKKLFAQFTERLMHGESITFETTILTKDGQLLPYECIHQALRDTDNTVIGIAGSGRNVTVRKQKEEELLKQKKDLEQINKVMTGRELKMMELKKQITLLQKELAEKTTSS